MADAMVTARMSATKKTAGNRVLESLGSNASQAINELYDYLAEHKRLPWERERGLVNPVSPSQLRDALAWVDELALSVEPAYANMTIEEARRSRLGLGDGR